VRGRALACLAMGVVAVSWGAPLARLTDAAPLAVAAWRMSLAAGLLLLGRAAVGAPLVPPSRRGPAVLAGVLLGAHFGSWIPSLWLTSVSASVVLVSTGPLFLLLASPFLLGVRITGRNVASVGLAVAGVAIIARGDYALSPRALAGDALALAGAACMAGYLIIGKRLRGEVALGSYLGTVYGVAALLLLGTVAVAGAPLLPETRLAWLPLVGMAVGPTLVGHSTLNWALAHLEAYQVNLAVLLEPLLATFWVWLVLGEAPPLHVIPGGVLVLAGLALEFAPQRGGGTVTDRRE